jgi:mannose-1-phosphate guanylyltransferase/mannose-6-phosphate isomerase
MVEANDPPVVSIQPVILAGGASHELWPLSRAAYPKHLLQLHGDRTLLQETLKRVDQFAQWSRTNSDRGFFKVRVEDALVVCHERHRHLVVDQIGTPAPGAQRIILEPVSRGTAPAASIAAAFVDSNSIMLITPADHVVEDADRWAEAAYAGACLALEDKIVAFGVKPGRAETAFGYLRLGGRVGAHAQGHALEAFVEKPSPDAARAYVSAGKYLWNAGVYMVSAGVWLEAIAQAQPQIAQVCSAAVAAGREDGAFFRVDESEFARSPAISIDYGVMEPIMAADSDGPPRVGRKLRPVVVPLDAGWSDVGNWPSLLELACDSTGNVSRGDVQVIDSTDNVLFSSHRLLCAVGVQDLIAVETPDAVLIAHRDRSDDIPRLVSKLRDLARVEAEDHVRSSRPWGHQESLDAADRYHVKRLTVKPGARLSMQLHHHRAEHWVVVRGTARVIRDEEVFLLTENESTFIPVGMKHCLENPGTVPLEIIEVRSGTYLGEDDIVRFDE